MNAMKLSGFLTLILLVAGTWSMSAQEEPLVIKVAAKKGSVTSGSQTASSPVSIGQSIVEGSTITTGPDSAVDLFLGNQAGTLRLTEKAQLSITRFAVGARASREIEFHLQSGSLLGMGNQLPGESTYRVKVSNGLVEVLGKQFRINAQGFLVALEGKLVFAHFASPSSAVVLFELTAPPPSYFWPGHGVAAAPDQLVREVLSQASSRLK